MLNHISLIPDGNRRWAVRNNLSILEGHSHALTSKKINFLFDEIIKQKIKYLSIWGFSTENWKRSQKEKKYLFKLLIKKIQQFIEDAEKNQIRFRHIGRRDRLPRELLAELSVLEEITKKYNLLNVQLCLDYGGRDETLRSVSSYCKKWGNSNHLTEEKFSAFLDTYEIPDIDLIIRTGGEQRLSGFMPWQSAYSELYFTKTYFPDFSVTHLRKAIEEFKKRKRNFGK
jgi:undecaprenyl diphosphate synthase